MESSSDLQFSARSSRHPVCHSSQVDSPHQVHLARVDLEDVESRGLIGIWKLDFPVNSAWPQQGSIKNVYSVCGHEYLQKTASMSGSDLSYEGALFLSWTTQEFILSYEEAWPVAASRLCCLALHRSRSDGWLEIYYSLRTLSQS